MKYAKIMFLFLLTILAMSCVSAADNLTDNALEQDSNPIIQENTQEASEIASKINVTFDEKVYKENLTNITVELPESANGTLEVKINDYAIFNDTVNTTSVVIPIKLPQPKFPMIIANVWPPYDVNYYQVSAFYNGVEINVTHDLQVMLYPKNHAPTIGVPEEVLQYDVRHYYFMPAIQFPRSATGSVEIYVDGKLVNRTNVSSYFVHFNESLVTSLALGTHNILVNYSGDDYYYPAVVNRSFNVTNAVISIPQKIFLDHDDCISVYSKEKGNVSVYIDSKLVVKKALDKNGEFLYSLFKAITCGVHEIRVLVETDKFTRQKVQTANTTYEMDIYSDIYYIYGEDNTIEVYIPEDMDVKLFRATINNKTVPVKKSGQDLIIDISKYKRGNYSVNVTYLGDKKYYSSSVSANFTVIYMIDVPVSVEYGDGSEISLVLPSNAKGNLKVYINDKLYKSVKLVKGKASIDFDNLNPGEYTVRSLYDGKDYYVEDLIDCVYMGPSMTYESTVRVGDKNILYFEVPEKCKGKISVKIGSKKYSATIKDGYAEIDLSKLPVGDWDLDVKYAGADGYKDVYYVGVYVEKAPVKIRAISTNVAYNDEYKVIVIGQNGKGLKNAKVTFKINGKKVKTIKTNSIGIANFKIPAKYGPKKYTITAIYKKTKLSKKVSVKHSVTLKTSKVKKSSKLILKAKVNKALKSKRVTFKFNGKTYHAKTNSKGIAKVTLKKSALANLKVGSRVKIQATCLKDTVKKSLKVQK